MARSKSLFLLTIFSLIVIQVAGMVCTACDRGQSLCHVPKSNKTRCCSKTEKCASGKCVPKNPCFSADAVVCNTRAGLLCCGPDQTCGKNQCVPKAPLPVDTCDEGLTACTNIDGTSCCTDSQKCSNGICVDNTTCRLKDAVVCHVAAGLLCCGPDQTCGSDECLDSPPNTCEPGTTVCGNIDGSACCTADQLCSAGVCVAKA